MIPAFKTCEDSKYRFKNIPMDTVLATPGSELDFDAINIWLDGELEKGRVLLYCKDGESISAAFAIGYLMHKAKLDVGMATLKISQAISRV